MRCNNSHLNNCAPSSTFKWFPYPEFQSWLRKMSKLFRPNRNKNCEKKIFPQSDIHSAIHTANEKSRKKNSTHSLDSSSAHANKAASRQSLLFIVRQARSPPPEVQVTQVIRTRRRTLGHWLPNLGAPLAHCNNHFTNFTTWLWLPAGTNLPQDHDAG